MAEDNSWNEWNKHILKELERFNAGQERASERMAELKTDIDEKLNDFMSSVRSDLIGIQQKISTYNPNHAIEMNHDIANITTRVNDQEGRIRGLEKAQNQFVGKWTILGGVATMILAALISLFVSSVKASPPPPTLPPQNQHSEVPNTTNTSGP